MDISLLGCGTSSTTMAHAQTITLKAGIIALKNGTEGTSQSLLVEVIQKEQGTTEVTIEKLSGRGRVRTKKSKVVRHEETIKKLTEEFTGGIRTLV